MKKSPLEVAFFDLNGTIADDWRASLAGANACLRAYGAPTVTLPEYVQAIACDGDYQHFYQSRGLSVTRDDLYDVFFPAYAAEVGNFSTLRVFPGVLDTLDTLRDLGVEVHILTAARGDLVDRIVDAVGIRDHCTNIHAHIHNKQAQIHAVLDGMDIPRSACAMMGDIPADVLHAQKARIKGVRFVNPDVPEWLFDYVRPDLTAHRFADILSLCDAPS